MTTELNNIYGLDIKTLWNIPERWEIELYVFEWYIGDSYNNMYNCAETTVKGPICTILEIQPLSINQHYGRCQHKKAMVINTTIA